MTRIGIVVALVFAAALIALVSMVRVTGPGWSGMRGDGPVVSAAEPLVVPVMRVRGSTLVDSFSDPRGGATRVHHAIDIPAAGGVPVVAAADGRIEKLFTSRLGGLTIYERSPDGGTIYYYAHLAGYAPTLVEGQTVRRGQIIGTVGATGDADPSAPHLHFEIHRMAAGGQWWQGTEIDPYPLLKSAPTIASVDR